MLLGLRLCVVAIILAFVSAPAHAQIYQYDERGRLIRATYSDCSTIRYFYDASGNRTERIVLAGDGSCSGNLAPIAADDTFTFQPNDTRLFNLLGANGGAADSDPNGDVIRLVSVTQGTLPPTPSGALSVQIQSDREHVRIIAPATEGAYQFSYIVEDALGLTDVGSVSVTVSGASDGAEPGNVDPSLLARDDSGYFFNSASNPRVFSDLLANDIHDASAYIASVQNLSTGTVSVLADGRTVEHRASAHASGQHSYEYTLTDDSGAISTARVEFYINGINTFPGGPKVISYAVPYPQPLVTINLLEDFSDPDGDTIVINDLHLLIGPNDIDPSHAEWVTLDGSGSWLPSGAFVQFDDTTLYYSPPQTLVATLQENFHFYIFDGHTRSNGARVEITLDVPNEAPVAVDDAVGFGPGQSGEIWVLANDTDYNGDDLTIVAVSTPSQGGIASISGDGQRILFQASDGSTDQFTYTVADPDGETDTAMVDIIIQAQPVAGDDTLVIVANTETDIDVLSNDNDPDGDPIQLKSLSQPANSIALLSADLMTIRYQAGDVLGEDSFSYTITDDQLGEATAIVSVLVHAAPVTVDDMITVNPGSTIDFDVLANDSDPDGGELTITAISSADAHGTASISADGKTITYLADTPGAEAIAYTISDALGGTASGQANVTVNAVPEANSDAIVFGLWGGVTPIYPLENDIDADGDELTITAITQPGNGDSATIAADGKSINYYPLAAPADGAMTYTVSDGRGGFATGAITLLANSPPVAVDDYYWLENTQLGQPQILELTDNDYDPDGQYIRVLEVTQPVMGGQEVIQNGHVEVSYSYPRTVEYTAGISRDVISTETFTYTLFDGQTNGYSTATVTIDFRPFPSAVDDTVSVDLGQTSPIDVIANDRPHHPMQSPYTIESVSQPAQGGHVAIASDGRTVHYTPPPTPVTESFTYTVTNGYNGTSSATVTVSAGPSQIPPTARDDYFDYDLTTDWDYFTDGIIPSQTLDVLANDDDLNGDELTIISFELLNYPNATGEITSDGKQLIIHAENDGMIFFNYTISDGNGGTATAQGRLWLID